MGYVIRQVPDDWHCCRAANLAATPISFDYGMRRSPPVAARLAGVGAFETAHAGKPDCYGAKYTDQLYFFDKSLLARSQCIRQLSVSFTQGSQANSLRYSLYSECAGMAVPSALTEDQRFQPALRLDVGKFRRVLQAFDKT